VNVFFDVDDTLICSNDGTLRPLVRDTFERILADGHSIYVWSGVGIRWSEIEQHGLRPYVIDCFVKPLANHRESLQTLGVLVEPDFVVDDHAEVVQVFGGYAVRPYAGYDPSDREMANAYAKLVEVAATRGR
jgi:hypothetical protein